MTLILRKCWKNGSSSNGFYYGQVGERVNCPDWQSDSECGHGLHGLKEGNGDWSLLRGEDWLIIDADDQIIDIDNCKCKFNTGVILFRGTAEELSKTDYCHKMATNNCCAYYWALDIGNQDVMIDRIAGSKYAYYWARNIGNKDVMIDRITDSCYAYYWAMNIGSDDVMKSKVTEEYWIDTWNRAFPNNKIESK